MAAPDDGRQPGDPPADPVEALYASAFYGCICGVMGTIAVVLPASFAGYEFSIVQTVVLFFVIFVLTGLYNFKGLVRETEKES